MQFILFATLALAVATHAGNFKRSAFEQELSKTLNLEEFEADKKILGAEVEKEALEHKEETDELLSHIEPLSADVAESAKEYDEINAEVSKDAYEGDMILTTEQLELIMGNNTEGGRDKRQAWTPSSYPANIWGTSTIPFEFDGSVSEEVKRLVRAATRFWSTNTCVNFAENAAGKDRIKVVSKGGCYSSVGRVGGTQELSLQNEGCNRFATASHELEHALGVFHEQSRSDRDQYIDINYGNINKQSAYNFDKAQATQSFGVPYEFGSNMHYTQDSFALDYSKPTIVAKGYYAQYQDSMRGHSPSFLDVLLVNRFYKCDEPCKSKTNFCKNGGYLNVRGCSTCVCPEGWGGRDCTQKPDGCSYEIAATTAYQTKSITIGDSGRAYDNYMNCAYIFTAPAGKRLEIKFDGLWGGWGNGCFGAGIELKPRTDLAPRGLRFCGEKPKTVSYYSDSNRFPALVWTNNGQLRADIQFRYF